MRKIFFEVFDLRMNIIRYDNEKVVILNVIKFI
jgi:hypothetical protein